MQAESTVATNPLGWSPCPYLVALDGAKAKIRERSESQKRRLSRITLRFMRASGPWVAARRSASEQSQQHQQHDGAHRRGDDSAHDHRASDRGEVEHVPQPSADISADHADNDVADQAKAGPLQNSCGQPSGNRPHDERDDQALHFAVSPRSRQRIASRIPTTQALELRLFLAGSSSLHTTASLALCGAEQN